MRVYPHLQDTGGFFISVLRKVADLPVKDSPEKEMSELEPADGADADVDADADADADANANANAKTDAKADAKADANIEADKDENDNADSTQSPTRKKARTDNKGGKSRKSKGTLKEEPFLQLSKVMQERWASFAEWFGITDDFPTDQLMARSESSKHIYFVSKGVKDILWSTERGYLKIVNTGLRIATRRSPDGNNIETYRCSQEGAEILFPYVTKRVLSISEDELTAMIKEKNPLFTSFSKQNIDLFNNLPNGSVMFRVTVTKNGQEIKFVMAGWRATHSAYMLANKGELRRLRNLLLPNVVAEEVKQDIENKEKRRKRAEAAGYTNKRKRGT
eukprot:TRINITY_DN5322_c0_g1_i1.p1 TRINITY_DN5322_c0_g1~~TRINITY_DN5322_c0_g1_i1.p1  ORF type:complete len:368 (+),score=68.26 TRINITY_DN5322_c0_g1_i1:101-1105(+)